MEDLRYIAIVETADRNLDWGSEFDSHSQLLPSSLA